MHEPLEIVRRWHDALNAGDADAVVALSHDDVEVGGPRGTSKGAGILRDWVTRSGIKLSPTRWFARGDVIVAVQGARWRLPDGALSEIHLVASVFRVISGKVRGVARYDDVESALKAAGLTDADAV